MCGSPALLRGFNICPPLDRGNDFDHCKNRGHLKVISMGFKHSDLLESLFGKTIVGANIKVRSFQPVAASLKGFEVTALASTCCKS